ncbi:MAG: pectate lyase [Cellvibrio sp.]
MKIKHLLLGLVATALATTALAANRPAGYVTICKEGQTCSVAGTTTVAFGRSDQFIYKTLTGSFSCSQATFGGRIEGGNNECSIRSTSTSSSSSKPSSSSVSVSSVKSSSSSSSSVSSAGSCKAGSTITGKVDCGSVSIGTSCSEQNEKQSPVLILEEGASIKNLTIKAGGGADGIHCKGNCTLENVVWEDVCEDAATMLGGAGTVMRVIGGSAKNADDKVFQHNGIGSTIYVEDFNTYGTIGRLWASCGNCSNNAGPRKFIANGVNIHGPVAKPDGSASYVLRLNSNYGDKATVRNMKIKGYKLGAPKVCVQATGITKAEENAGAKQTNQGEFWNTAYCDISKSDVTSF